MLRRSVTVLGATGSVGEQTLALIADLRARGEADITVEALTADTNWKRLAELAVTHGARFAACADRQAAERLREALAGHDIEVGIGDEGVCEAARREAGWVMAAIVGIAGLPPLLAAAKRGADVAFANKECLVSAGEVVLAAMRAGGGKLLPVDSEHNAIFQVLDRPERVRRLVLTASGGPFRTRSLESLAAVTPAEACAHPNWTMGAKISVDSATMMNKGLELIEAAFLFPVPKERIEVLVHPQSVIHSMVDYVDGSTLAQLGAPDMTIPIASALAWPDRVPTRAAPLDLAEVGTMTFERPDEARFPALRLARQALDAGGLYPAVLNAANEVAVAAFLKGHLPFLDIARVTEHCLAHECGTDPSASLDAVTAADARARRTAQARITAVAA
ncbi:1-deoxy-D-xylulose-5-phosphate reductoisomerase [Parvularcula dongshanensis]|uniref:1-deoxy-D-xylulose 5-phosphate reductoisomerase n=1 Tax=Parvularcula dongshanensis TaxID=1173995 RepID=A0A840I1K0_9PROT|nr:1-deoxy-D-xylulose-5-phosphate reductoisomerase [Parvularcula dongshanensis]MBB4658627.1 1-deoxy-D-xylulose-5-phosphate reductoisomerase [Parvularcula dongshanensis]